MNERWANASVLFWLKRIGMLLFSNVAVMLITTLDEDASTKEAPRRKSSENLILNQKMDRRGVPSAGPLYFVILGRRTDRMSLDGTPRMKEYFSHKYFMCSIVGGQTWSTRVYAKRDLKGTCLTLALVYTLIISAKFHSILNVSMTALVQTRPG